MSTTRTTTRTKDRLADRLVPVTRATALSVAFAVSLVQPANAARITLPPMPDNIQVPAGHHAFLKGRAVGTQNYVCVPSATSATGVVYALFTPEATLFNDDDEQLTTHFFSPNVVEPNASPKVIAAGVIRATWQHSRDGSRIWGKVRLADPTIPGDTSDSSMDPRFVAPGSIAWLKVTATGTAVGPNGGDILAKTTFVQRLNTNGGLAPTIGCSAQSDLGNQAFIPYTADYFFYTDE
jgi:hypothetical protein